MMNKQILKLFLLLITLISGTNVISQNYYWVGGSGNWSDVSHWSSTSGGTSNYNQPPSATSNVIFDINSFSSTGQTVTFDMSTDVTIKSMRWKTSIDGNIDMPTFISTSSAKLTINGTLLLDVNMTYQFQGKLFFTSGAKDTLYTNGNQLLNDIYISNFETNIDAVYDTSFVLATNFSSLGGIIYNRGAFRVSDKQITAKYFSSRKSNPRQLLTNNVIFNLTGEDTVIYINPSSFTKNGSNEIFNVSCATDSTVKIFMGSNTIAWNTLNLLNKKTYFLSQFNFTNLVSTTSEYIRFKFSNTHKTNNFAIAGNCGKLVKLECPEGPTYIDGMGTAIVGNYLMLRNIVGATGSTYTANNSLDLLGNTNWVINETATVSTYYWIGGTGSFYEPGNWSLTSGGPTPSACVPGPNDIAIFDALSVGVDTLYIDRSIIIGRLNFQNIPATCVIAGPSNYTIQVRENLIGSVNLQFDWQGTISMTGTASPTTITSNGLTWTVPIKKTGTATLNFGDNFACSKSFSHENGMLSSGSFSANFYEFYANKGTNNRSINFSNSVITVSGTNYEINLTTLIGSYSTPQELKFTNSTGSYVKFISGTYSYNIVRIQTANIDITVDDATPQVSYTLFEVNPGSTVILQNGSQHTCSSMNIMGTCQNLITLKTNSSTDLSAVLIKTANVTTTVEYVIIDNVDAGLTGNYFASFSSLLNNPLNWISTAGASTTYTVNFSVVPATIAGGANTTLTATLSGFNPALITSSNLSFTGVSNTSGSNLNNCTYELTGAAVLAQGSFTGTGAQSGLTFNFPNVTSSGNGVVNLILTNGNGSGSMTVSNATLTFTYIPGPPPAVPLNYYWVGNSGNWSDLTHWSTVSGGTTHPTCSPTLNDNVIFDNNSFTLQGQTVTVDKEVYVNAMSWILTDPDQAILMLDKSMTFLGNVQLNNQVFATRNNKVTKMVFQPSSSSNLSASGSIVDVPVVLLSSTSAETLNLTSSLNMTDSVLVIIGGGVFNTNNNNLNTGSLYFGSNTGKTVNLGTSTINLRYGFVDQNLNSSLALDATNATINVNYSSPTDSVFDNYFISKGHSFKNVTLNFNFNNYSDFTGRNVFQNLTIGKGSKLKIPANDTIKVTNQLTMLGTCLDSIYVKSGTAGNKFVINAANTPTIECVSIKDANSAGTNITALYSTNLSSIGNFTFSTLQAATSTLTTISNYCYGDTLQFTNGSTSVSGTPTYTWDFGDGTIISGDTSMHYYELPGEYLLQLTTYNSNDCSDKFDTLINILDPSVQLASSLVLDTIICAGDPVSFYATANPDTNTISFQYFINSVASVANDTLTTTNLTDLDTVTVVIYQDLCPATSNAFVFDVNPLPVALLTTNNTNVICQGEEVVLTGSGADLYQYYRNGLPVTAFIAGPLILNNVVSGDSFYMMAKNSTTMCQATSNIITFTVNQRPSVSIDDNDPLSNTICQGDLVQITSIATLPANVVSYDYIINGISVSTSSSSSYSTSSLVNQDVLSVVVTDLNGCKSDTSNQITYFVNSIPVITVTSNLNNFCQGQTVTLSSSGGTAYEFNVNGNIVSPMSGDNYFITNQLQNGDVVTVVGLLNNCPNTSAPLTINVISLPTTTISSSIGNVFCSSQSPSFVATSTLATSFQFFVNGSSVQGPSPLNTFNPTNTLANGSIISVIGYQGVCQFQDFMTVTVNSSPVPFIYSNDTDNTICETGSLTVTATGGSSYEYFINGNSQGLTAGNLLINGSSLTAGLNQVYAVVSSANGCSTASPVLTLTRINLPILSLSSSAVSNTICQGSSVSITATPTANQYQFFLNGISMGLPSTSNIFTTTALSNGDVVTVIGYNANCPNAATNSITTTVNPIPSANIIGSTAFCQGSNLTLEAEQGSSYQFIIDGVPLGFGADSLFNVSSLGSGTHTLGVNVQSNGCIATSSTNLTVISLPVVSLAGDNTLCSGQLGTFVASGASQYMFLVNNVDVNNGFVSNPNFSYALNNNDVVSVIGSNYANCESINSTAITVSVSPTPTVTLVSNDPLNDLMTCVNDLLTFTASGATNYQFFVNGFATGSISSQNTFSTSSLQNGQAVTVTGESNGCTNTVTSGPFTVSNYPIVNIVNNDDNALCVDETADLTANGASSYLFYINGNPQGVFSANPNFNLLLSDGDVITVEGMTNTCVSLAGQTETFQVFDYPNTSFVSSSAASNNVICYGDEVTFTGSGASTYEYFVDGVSYPSANGILVLNDIADGQIISLTGYNDACPTPANPAIQFTVNTMDLVTSVTPSNYMICAGDPLTINISGADSYELFINNSAVPSLSSTTGNFVVNNLSAGDYITIDGYLNATQCTQTDDQTIYVQVNGPVNYTVDGDLILCEGDSSVLTSNLSFGNQWFLDGNPIPGATNQTYTVLSSGNYSLEANFGGSGELWSTGYNANGEFGNGNNFNNGSPELANILTALSEVKTGYGHMIALDNSGLVFTWGSNTSGQLGNGTYTASNVPIQVISIPSSVSVDAGNDFCAAISNTGGLFVWGGNNYGQLGLGNTTVYSNPQLVTAVGNALEVACGSKHTLVLKSDGTVVSAGNNDFGQLGNGTLTSSSTFVNVTGLSNIVHIETGDYHSLAIDNQGFLYVWGNNVRGQLGLNDLSNRTVPTLSPLKNIRDCSGGNAHSVFVNDLNRAYTTGANDYGQLGTNDLVDRDSPVLVGSLNAVDKVTAGAYHTLFKKIDGSVWGTGRNDNFQLGNLSAGSITNVQRMTDLVGVVDISAGTENSHFIYGNSSVCSSQSTAFNVLSAPQPVIVSLGSNLVISAVGASYQWYIDGIEIINSNSQSITPSEFGYYTVSVTYGNGCISTSNPYPYGVTAIGDVLEMSLSIYPNPTNGMVTLEGDQLLFTQKIYVTDLQGRKVNEIWLDQSTNEVTLSLESFEAGVYHLNLVDETNKVIIKKLIKN